MNGISLNYQFKNLTFPFSSCSVLNSDGALLYSKDKQRQALTTTRLVAFQIVKKYLNPQPGDFFILNDPENGGFHYGKLIFITALNENLYIVWNEDLESINFKIPPTPLFDRGVKNDFVWKALVGNCPDSDSFETFILFQKNKIERLSHVSELVQTLSQVKTQQLWFKSCTEVFNILFANKANGSFESSYKLTNGQYIKLKFSAEEKQNLRLFTLDLSNTNLATDFHAASHIAESAMVKKLIDFYDIGEHFAQPILDKIKVILPPRSIVSKPHTQGLYNIEIQGICTQLLNFIIGQLNSPSRKAHSTFEYSPFLSFKLDHNGYCYDHYIGKDCYLLESVEDLILKNKIAVSKLQKSDGKNFVGFKIKTAEPIKLILSCRPSANSNISIKINGELPSEKTLQLKQNDLFELGWSDS